MLSHQKFIEILAAGSIKEKEYKDQLDLYASALDSYIKSEFLKIDFSFEKVIYGQDVSELSESFNLISARVVADILNQETIDAAISVYSFYVDLAIKAGENKNLHLEQAIVSGLSNQVVSRLFGSMYYLGNGFSPAKIGYCLLDEKVKNHLESLSMDDPKKRYPEELANQKELLPPVSVVFGMITHSKDANKMSKIYSALKNMTELQESLGLSVKEEEFDVKKELLSNIKILGFSFNDSSGIADADVEDAMYKRGDFLLEQANAKPEAKSLVSQAKNRAKEASKDMRNIQIEKRKKANKELKEIKKHVSSTSEANHRNTINSQVLLKASQKYIFLIKNKINEIQKSEPSKIKFLTKELGKLLSSFIKSDIFKEILNNQLLTDKFNNKLCFFNSTSIIDLYKNSSEDDEEKKIKAICQNIQNEAMNCEVLSDMDSSGKTKLREIKFDEVLTDSEVEGTVVTATLSIVSEGEMNISEFEHEELSKERETATSIMFSGMKKRRCAPELGTVPRFFVNKDSFAQDEIQELPLSPKPPMKSSGGFSFFNKRLSDHLSSGFSILNSGRSNPEIGKLSPEIKVKTPPPTDKKEKRTKVKKTTSVSLSHDIDKIDANLFRNKNKNKNKGNKKIKIDVSHSDPGVPGDEKLVPEFPSPSFLVGGAKYKEEKDLMLDIDNQLD
ncbi:RasGEF domain-containing protein [Thiotrichales bacterium 19S11-10]|nr:RasGEF domain-containing protein [Thiotrichales bacterium 19S11-10]